MGMTSTAGFGAVTGLFWERTVRRWNAVCWVLYGLLSAAIVVLDPPGEHKTWSLVLLGVLAACYAAVMAFPGHRVLRPHAYLWVLVLSRSGLAYLRTGYAALFMVTLPHF